MKQVLKISPIYTCRKQDKKWSGQHKHEEHEVFGPAFPRIMTLQIISFCLEVIHNVKNTSRRQCTFFRPLQAYFGQFWLFCREFSHFLVYFYRPEHCGGVPKLTHMRYAHKTNGKEIVCGTAYFHSVKQQLEFNFSALIHFCHCLNAYECPMILSIKIMLPQKELKTK